MRTKKNKIYLIGVVLSIIAGFVSLFSIYGKESGLASLITVFITGFTGGASLTAYISERRKGNDKKK